ncbi:ADSL, partial [Symbiodinium necroappetens]
MQRIWSDSHRFGLWRKIWLAVAEAQHEMGLPVTKEQVEELRTNLDITDADIDRAKEIERELRHDVMSHVHAWGEKCPNAKGIIHLGMTSQDVNDNAELWQINKALKVIHRKLAQLELACGVFGMTWKSTPTLAFTHYQPAQPTTLGRRAAQWAFDLHVSSFTPYDEYPLPIRGVRGATGTMASYLSLFDNDAEKARRLDANVVRRLRAEIDEQQKFPYDLQARTHQIEQNEKWRADAVKEGNDARADHFAEQIEQLSSMTDEDYAHGIFECGHSNYAFELTTQTYPRVFDAQVVSGLASIACVLHKMATDIRLLSNRKTAATQWLERTLDDSANRRLTLPEAFLALDGCLDIMRNVISGLVVHEKTIEKNLMAELPFMASENLMMEAVKLGRDRQEVHEAIRLH